MAPFDLDPLWLSSGSEKDDGDEEESDDYEDSDDDVDPVQYGTPRYGSDDGDEGPVWDHYRFLHGQVWRNVLPTRKVVN